MGRPTKAEQANIVERRTKAIALRIRGRSWQAIADELDYGDAAAACKDFSRAMAQRLREQNLAMDELREQELARLDALEATVWEVLERDHLTVSHGKVIKVRDPNGEERTLHDDGPTLAAVDRLVRIAERRAKLLGLDSAVKVDAHGVVTFAIEGVDPDQLR